MAVLCQRLHPRDLRLITINGMQMFPPKTLLERLQASPVRLMRGSARDLLSCKQTLGRAIKRSYDLLEEGNSMFQAGFRCSSVAVRWKRQCPIFRRNSGIPGYVFKDLCREWVWAAAMSG